MAVKMKWVSDIDRTVLVSNFERLGWVRGTTEGKEGERRHVYPDTIVNLHISNGAALYEACLLPML